MNKNTMRVFSISTDKQTRIRIPAPVLNSLKAYANENGRSFNNEVLNRLVRSLVNDNGLLIKQGENNENI